MTESDKPSSLKAESTPVFIRGRSVVVDGLAEVDIADEEAVLEGGGGDDLRS